MDCLETSCNILSRPRLRPILGKRSSSPIAAFSKPKPPAILTYRCRTQQSPVCLMGGKDRAEDEGAAWKAFGKAMEKFSNGQSIEEVLRQQMKSKKYYVGGNGGKIPPGGGGRGGGGGDDGQEGNEGARNEAKQVILATLGFLFLYIYVINGWELTLLGRDYIRYLSNGRRTLRLKNAMYSWERFWMRLREKVFDKNWLALVNVLVNIQSWYNNNRKYRIPPGSHIASRSFDG